MTKVRKPLPLAQAKLQERAEEEMKRWRSTLNAKDRAKLTGDGSTVWARKGGKIIALAQTPRRTKQRRQRERLKREREARLRAERAAYEARRNAEGFLSD
jgi:hypothetical protein